MNEYNIKELQAESEDFKVGYDDEATTGCVAILIVVGFVVVFLGVVLAALMGWFS